jgi:hypothetical protein
MHPAAPRSPEYNMHPAPRALNCEFCRLAWRETWTPNGADRLLYGTRLFCRSGKIQVPRWRSVPERAGSERLPGRYRPDAGKKRTRVPSGGFPSALATHSTRWERSRTAGSEVLLRSPTCLDRFHGSRADRAPPPHFVIGAARTVGAGSTFRPCCQRSILGRARHGGASKVAPGVKHYCNRKVVLKLVRCPHQPHTTKRILNKGR